MKPATVFATILMLAFTPAQALEITGGTDADVTAVLAIKDEWQRAYEAGDLDALLDLYTDDAFIQMRGIPAVDAAKDRDGFNAFFARLIDRPGLNVMFDEDELFFYEDNTIAHSIAKFVASMPGPDGSTIYDAARGLLMYRKGDDGKWRIWRDLDTPSPDAEALIPSQTN